MVRTDILIAFCSHGHSGANDCANSLHEVAHRIQLFNAILHSKFGSLASEGVCHSIVISHVNLSNKNANGCEIRAKRDPECDYTTDCADAADAVHDYMASPLRIKNLNIITHKPINNFQTPWNSNQPHENLHLRRLNLQSVLVKRKQAQIQELLEALGEVAQV